MKFQQCPHCQKISYCSQYCREVDWTRTHNMSCRSINHDRPKEDSTVACLINRCSETIPTGDQENNMMSMFHRSTFETLPVQIAQPSTEATAEITSDLGYPSSSSSSSSNTKKKSFRTLLSFLRMGSRRR